MPTNEQSVEPELPFFNRHQLSVLIDDILLMENFVMNEEAETISRYQIKHNLIITFLTVQKIVRDDKVSPRLLEKLHKKFELGVFAGMELSKKNLNKQPKLLQLPFLISQVSKVSKPKLTEHQITWLKIGIYLSLILKHHKLKTYYSRVIQRIKVAIFYKTKIKTWILENLPSFETPMLGWKKTEEDEVVKALNPLYINNLIDYLTLLEKNSSDTKINQIHDILLSLRTAVNPKYRKEADKITKQEKKKRQQKQQAKKRNKLKKPTLTFNQPITRINQAFNSHDDIENQSPNLQAYYPRTGVEEDIIPFSESVTVDNLGDRLLDYQNINTIPFAIRYNAPLQIVDLSVQQMHISQRELELNSSVYLLSPKAYQLVFAKLIADCQLNMDNLSKEQLKQKTLASVLLTSMITAVPVASLIQKGFIKQSGLFNFFKKSVYLTESLNITKRKQKFDPEIFENKKDTIELPLPLKLVGFLANRRLLPKPDDIRAYVRDIRETLSLPYFSIHRVESALHTILSRYIKGSNNHIADIICRIPPETAPAKFYSSHEIEEIISHYKNAIVWLRQDRKFDLKFLEHKKSYTTGSGQALTLPFIKQRLKGIFDELVMTSLSKTQLFNHVSCYIWLIFCLTTGIRPNNHITHVHNIDLDDAHAQILISDKPNRAVRNPRLVPICPTLVTTLNLYRVFLSRFSQLMHQTKWINQTIKPILQQHDDSDSMLINLIHERDEKIRTVKRRQIYQMIKPFFDIDPYFTRHFVRTQLEKRGVAMPLINAVIGHEKNRQEFFGKFSSGAKADLDSVTKVFEQIAHDLGLFDIEDKFKQIESRLRVLPDTLVTTDLQEVC